MVRDDGQSDPAAVEAAMAQTIKAHHLTLDYAVLRHARTLAPVECVEPDAGAGVAAVVAGRVDGVRLIDNMIL
jgi:pantothenate synthetase